MQFSTTSNINNSIRNMKMEMRWQKRKENPYMAKGQEEDPQITRLKQQAADVQKSNIISNLDGKLKSGATLTDDEMEYLKQNSPDLYQKAVEVKKEREEYKRELQRCKTKEDVERLNLRKLQNFMAEAKAITSNASIPEGKKKELMDQLCRRVMGTNSEHQTFLQSDQYAKLPSEEEIEKGKAKKKNNSELEQKQPENIDLKQPGEPSSEDLFRQLQEELGASDPSKDTMETLADSCNSDDAGTYNPSKPVASPGATQPTKTAPAPSASTPQNGPGSILYNSGGKATAVHIDQPASSVVLSEKA